MLETMSRYWWALALRGAAAVIFGLLALIWPDITLIALVILFAAYALVDGALAIGSAVFDRGPGSRAWLVVWGIAGVTVGIVALVWPRETTLVLLYLIAFWAIVTGVIEIFTAVRLRREMRREWMLGLGGVLSVAFGALLVVWPASGALALVLLIGAYAFVFGVVLIGLALRLRRARPGSARGGSAQPVPA
jgi:uncharacterized membrane protein HdeD (DUF308 family)